MLVKDNYLLLFWCQNTLNFTLHVGTKFTFYFPGLYCMIFFLELKVGPPKVWLRTIREPTCERLDLESKISTHRVWFWSILPMIWFLLSICWRSFLFGLFMLLFLLPLFWFCPFHFRLRFTITVTGAKM